ncbi:MAG: DUF362 domain-containing protein [Actinomycetota bacterium]|nr:DUF362 domain-containing protein [Actinomycetota bacterium]
MDERRVALQRCGSYQRDVIEERVARAFDLLGGTEAIIGRGESVFLKVNALSPATPDKAVTTHPEVVWAVINQVKEVASDIIVGDTHVGPHNNARHRQVYRRTGLARVAEETGVPLSYGTEAVLRPCPGGRMLNNISICKEIADCDRLISLSKLKTHLLMNVSGAVKNVYGVVPGMTKFTYHAMFQNQEDFANLLVDVVLATAPDLHLMDAVVGMDGNGPRQGKAVEVGVIAASRDPFALDALMTELVGLDTRLNLPLKAAWKRGLCDCDPNQIEVVGDEPGTSLPRGFRLPTDRSIIAYFPSFFMRIYGRRMSFRPHPNTELCTGCGKCADICPVSAVSIKNGTAVIDSRKCIRCYCCDEACEYDAMDLRRPWLMRLFRQGD